jgi:hypothetical protein
MEKTQETDFDFKIDHLKNFSTIDVECTGANPGVVQNHSNSFVNL